MRRFTGMALVAGVIVAVVAGCGILPNTENMSAKLKTEASTLEQSNYESTAMMTVQMDNSSQSYYIETAYEAHDTYRIKLGDANGKVNQIIVRNQNGMFIVSPSLKKVFRFNGNWAQNQGHIYLYDQILQQLAQAKNLKPTNSSNSGYTFEIPASTGNDVVTKEQVTLTKDLHPKTVILFDQSGKAVVRIDFKTFKTNVKFQQVEFDPNHLVGQDAAKATLATVGGNGSQAAGTGTSQTPGNSGAGVTSPTTTTTTDMGYVVPSKIFNDTLYKDLPSPTGRLLRYMGPHDFVLTESVAQPSQNAFQFAQMVDLFGTPAVFTDIGNDKQLVWLNNGMQFMLSSKQMNLSQMEQVAISTMGQVTK